MHILLVVTGLPDRKTPARSVFNLSFAKRLRDMNQHVTILYLRSAIPTRSFLDIINMDGLECIVARCFISRFFLIRESIFLKSLFQFFLRRKVVSEKLKQVDVIHAIGGGAIEGASLISSIFDKPMISQFIGSDLNTHFNTFVRSEGFLEGIDRSTYLCFNSGALRDVFLTRFPEVDRTRILYRGVDLSDFSFYFMKSADVKILFLGGFPGNTNSKGGYTLIDAIRLLNRHELSCRLHFIIGGPNAIENSDLINEVDNKNIKIEFIGAIDKIAVKQKMRDSHIVVIPSLAEGLPNVLYEAMASGNMVIGTDVGGIPEILDDKFTGELIPVNDPTALSLTILGVVSDLSKIEEYAFNGRQKIESMDYNKFIDGYLSIYRSSLRF